MTRHQSGRRLGQMSVGGTTSLLMVRGWRRGLPCSHSSGENISSCGESGGEALHNARWQKKVTRRVQVSIEDGIVVSTVINDD